MKSSKMTSKLTQLLSLKEGMKLFSNYGKISTELYDFTKPVGTSINGDIEYYMERLKSVEGKVLEAGVGTGRFIIPLLEEGFTVDGVDYSNEMLQICKENCKERKLKPNLYEANLESLQLPSKYEAIVMPTGSFCLIDGRKDGMTVLNNFKDHLEMGGRLIIDLLLPYDFKEGEIETDVFTLPNDEGIILERRSDKIDWINQTTTTYLKYEKWKLGKLIDTELQKFPLTWYGMEEFRSILKSLGFINITCSSNYVFERYPVASNEIITFEAEKG